MINIPTIEDLLNTKSELGRKLSSGISGEEYKGVMSELNEIKRQIDFATSLMSSTDKSIAIYILQVDGECLKECISKYEELRKSKLQQIDDLKKQMTAHIESLTSEVTFLDELIAKTQFSATDYDLATELLKSLEAEPTTKPITSETKDMWIALLGRNKALAKLRADGYDV